MSLERKRSGVVIVPLKAFAQTRVQRKVCSKAYGAGAPNSYLWTLL